MVEYVCEFSIMIKITGVKLISTMLVTFSSSMCYAVTSY